MRLLIALGGNALAPPGESLAIDTQRRHIMVAAAALAPACRGREVVLTHGSGPQVGWLARAQAALDMPLHALDAETQGLLGYLIELELRNALPGRDVLTLLSQVVVAAEDTAFLEPTKLIGPLVSHGEALRLQALGQTVRPVGEGYRRVVASPAPRDLLEQGAVKTLLDAGWLVIYAGGGGIPVTAQQDGRWRGVDAVVDKDATSALLAERIGMDRLVMLTDVDAVYVDWETPKARALGQVTPQGLAVHEFAAGSMGPKVAAACGFVTRTGGSAAIGRLADAVAVVAGTAGTQIRLDPESMPQSSK